MADKKICPLLTVAKSAIVAHRKGDGDMVQNCVEKECAWWIEGYPESDVPNYKHGACTLIKLALWLPES